MEMVHLTATDMTWQRFEVCNPNQKIAFENLCRAVFNQDFFGGTAHFHSNPNNPGVEIEPIYHKETEKRISFQSKYFTSTDYDQIAFDGEMHNALQWKTGRYIFVLQQRLDDHK